MDFTSYQMVANSTSSLNTGSYLNRTEYSLFVKGFTTDLWYGMSENDVIELGVWDRENNFIGWRTFHPDADQEDAESKDIQISTYSNRLGIPYHYPYLEQEPEFIQYKNEKVLVNPTEQLSSSFGIFSGSYFLTYNFVRNMAGDINHPLIIKDISPSRRELKLIPLLPFSASYTSPGESYDSFCNKTVLIANVAPLYFQGVNACPYGQIYSKISPLYPTEINTIKSIFFLNTDGAMVKFLQNLYEDIIIYTTTPVIKGNEISNTSGSATKIQGIHTSFDDYLLSNLNKIVDFSDVDRQFNGYVSASIERKFSPIGRNPLPIYTQAKMFVYDFFTKYFYQPISDIFAKTYREKYFGTFRNALNLGNNRLLSILEHGVIDERQNPTDPLTLLVKLQSELPSDLAIQTSCWVSNIAMVPYVVNAIVKNPKNDVIHKIGPPNFSVVIPDVSLTNINKSYTATDLQQENNEIERELTVSRNLTELNVDYTDFQNFVVFSSAELRLKIFKNKSISISGLSASIDILDQKNTASLSTNGYTYPLYTSEWTTIQGQIDEIVNTFDGYESYLYRSGNYTISNGTFVSSSYIGEMDNSASYYDKNNRDSLINNCPAHILSDSDNDEYIVFLSMIGHFFDEIYIYIANLPSEKRVGHSATEAFTRRIVDYMLETFGWSLDDSLEQTNLINNYLTSDQQVGLNSMSAEDRLKEIRNRILINLPRIYKTKGTEESVRTILACYGIPSSLLSVREYGGVDYGDSSATYTTYERSYMYQWDASSKYDHFRTNLKSNCHTFLLKFCVDDAESYVYGKEQIMLASLPGGAQTNDPTGSGNWALGFVREPGQNLGKMFFRIGYETDVKLKIDSPSFPLFDGSIYSVMVRRNTGSIDFEYDPITNITPCAFDLYVQKNEFGRQILRLTSSQVSYDYATNLLFESGGSYLVLGGWFADHNGVGFTGAMDKLQVWYDPILDSNFEDYVNSINAYSFNGSRPAHQSLITRMHTDYPFDMRHLPPGTVVPPNFIGLRGSYDVWMGKWINANPFYAISSSTKQTTYLGTLDSISTDFMVNWGSWSGSQKLVYDSASCQYISQSTYPWQFKVVEYPSTWGVSKYGPNRYHNEKVHHILQSVSARFDDKDTSTYTPRNNTSPDSNQIGFFVDPQDFHNKDIVRYFGNFDFMDAIGDPMNQYSSSYQDLNLYRKQYATSLNEYSGSRTLFNELITLYKLYFNRSIFEAIKNVVPARANALVGVLIEPSILERPKYPSKPIFSEVNIGSVFYSESIVGHYSGHPTKLCSISESLLYGEFSIPLATAGDSASNFDYTTLPNNRLIDLDQTYINLPNRIYPFNYLPGGTYVENIPDKFQLGHFSGEVAVDSEPAFPILYPTAAFVGYPLEGAVPLTVKFTNNSINSFNYDWTFGDTLVSSEKHPTHIYTTTGSYTVTLTVRNPNGFNSSSRIDYITVLDMFADFTSNVTSGTIPFSVIFTNTSVNATDYSWNFGDGGSSNEENPTHTYTVAGNYTVILTATNGAASNTKTGVITAMTNKRLVIQICNQNSIPDDSSYTVYLNNNFIGTYDGHCYHQCYSLFIGDINPNISVPITQNTFACPQTYGNHGVFRFDPAFIVDGNNILNLKYIGNTQGGTFSVIGMRTYILSGTTLINPSNVRNIEDTDFTAAGDHTSHDFDVPFVYNL